MISRHLPTASFQISCISCSFSGVARKLLRECEVREAIGAAAAAAVAVAVAVAVAQAAAAAKAKQEGSDVAP